MMAKKQKAYHSAGKQTQNSTIPKLAKLLFQILQCLHHLANIGLPEKGITAKAFLKKQRELDTFVRPAQELPRSEFRQFFQKLTKTYFELTLEALVTHYQTRLRTLRIEILNLGINTSDLRISIEIAIRWGRKNFRSKLKQDTLDQFQRVMAELTSDLSSFRNSTQTPNHLPGQLTSLAQETVVTSSSHFSLPTCTPAVPTPLLQPML